MVSSATAGWGVTLCFIVANAFRRREPWAWWALLEGAACLASGVTVKLYVLATAGVGFAIPLLLSRRYIFGHGKPMKESAGPITGEG